MKLEILRDILATFAALLLALSFGAAPLQAQSNAQSQADSAAEASKPNVDVKVDDEATTSSAVDNITENLKDMTADSPVFSVIGKILFGTIITIDGQQITIFKLIIALLLLIIGAHVAKRISKLFEERIFERFRVEAAACHFLEKLVRFTLIALISLFALDFAGIPLSIFAFLGGAIAIAVGFGAQELLANFIGGLILMFEKPIRKGDLIEYNDVRGKVEVIGARCTILQLPGNVDYLVPNRKLLENPLTNWTLSDRLVRTMVSVGVAYGSPVRKVRNILDQAVKDHERVEKDPNPIVIFDEFGDNSLVFEVFFWVYVSNFMDQKIIESDIRFSIDEAFRDEDIVISFPQRDVHLDTLKPIDIKLHRAQRKETEKPKKTKKSEGSEQKKPQPDSGKE